MPDRDTPEKGRDEGVGKRSFFIILQHITQQFLEKILIYKDINCEIDPGKIFLHTGNNVKNSTHHRVILL